MTTPFPIGAASRAASADEPAAVTGSVRWILRAEGVAGLVICVAFYALTGFGWGYFALLFLVPDLSMLFYLLGPRVGAVAYNVAHSTVGPVLLGTAGFVLGNAVIPSLALRSRTARSSSTTARSRRLERMRPCRSEPK